jgi:hypothetical protein
VKFSRNHLSDPKGEDAFISKKDTMIKMPTPRWGLQSSVYCNQRSREISMAWWM